MKINLGRRDKKRRGQPNMSPPSLHLYTVGSVLPPFLHF